jgi:hypothetical protein
LTKNCRPGPSTIWCGEQAEHPFVREPHGHDGLERAEHIVECADHHQQTDRARDEQVAPLLADLVRTGLALAVKRVELTATLGCLVAHVAHSLLHRADRDNARDSGHARSAQAEIDHRAEHAVEVGQRALDVRDARGAGHPTHIEGYVGRRNRVANVSHGGRQGWDPCACRVIGKVGLPQSQVDNNARHAGYVGQRTLNVRHTRGAGHALDGQGERLDRDSHDRSFPTAGVARQLLLRALIGSVVVVACAMASMIIVPTVHAAHHQQMHQWAQENERKGQCHQNVRGMIDKQVDQRGSQDGRQRRALWGGEDCGQAAWWRLLRIHVMLLV